MADGKTYAETLRNAEEVMREWIDYAKELGREKHPNQRDG
jgi:predicted RNase H-like HicB family nuclease